MTPAARSACAYLPNIDVFFKHNCALGEHWLEETTLHPRKKVLHDPARAHSLVVVSTWTCSRRHLFDNGAASQVACTLAF